METEGNYFAYCLDTNTKKNYFIVPSKYLKPRANARHSNPGVAWDTLGQEFWGGVFQSAWHVSLEVDLDDGSFLDQTPKTDADFEHLLTEAEYKECLVLATASSVQELQQYVGTCNIKVPKKYRRLDFSDASGSQQHDESQQNEKRLWSSECNQQTKNEDFSTASKSLEKPNSTSKNVSTGATPFVTPIVFEDPIESHDDSENEIDYSHIRSEGVANLGFFEYEIDGKVNRQNADNVCVLVIHYDFINDPLFRNGDASDIDNLKTSLGKNRNCNFRDILSPSKKTLLKLLSDREKLLRFFNLQDEVPSVFMLFFLSHGTVNGEIWTNHFDRETNNRVSFTTDEVFDSLQKLQRFDQCLKVVNFGSCRGSLYDSKFCSKNSLENYENKNSCRITSHPGMHNCVVFYSTVETTLANTDGSGSWFVKNICTSLNEAIDEPLLNFFTIVQSRMHQTSCKFTTFDKNIPLGQTPELKMFTQDRKFLISKTTIAAKPFSNTDGSGNVSKVSNEILSREFSWKSNEGQDIRGRKGFILSLAQNKQVQEVKRALHKLDFHIRDWSLSSLSKDFYFKMVSELEPDVGCILTCIFGPVCVNKHKEVCVRVQKGQEIPIKDILHSLVGPKNDKLIGKPKILFVVNVEAPQTDNIPVPMKDLRVDATNHSGWLVLILKFEDALEKLIELLGNIGGKSLQEHLGPLLTRESNIEEMVLLNSTLQYLLTFPTWPRTFVKPDFALKKTEIPRGEMSRFKYLMGYPFEEKIDFKTLIGMAKQLFEENKNKIELQTKSHQNKTKSSSEDEPLIISLKNIKAFSTPSDSSDASYFWIFNSVAGAGKSTVLVEMAHQLAKIVEGFQLLLIPLKKHYRYLREMPLHNVNEVNFLAKTTCNSHDDINNWIKKREVIVFLDGFDEVCPDYREKIIKILIALNNARVPLFIGTRPHELHHIQERIKNSTIVEIEALDEEKQIKFLKKVAGKKEEEIKQLRTNFKDKHILGNPLYLKLLAEYKGDGNLYDIFDKIVRNKVQICLKRENGGNDVGEEAIKNSLKFIQLVASRFLTGVKIDQGSVTKEALEKINAFGVVTYCNERVDFTHQTFAEFLTAQKFIYDLINPVAEEVPLFNDELVQCRKFVDLFFSMEKGKDATYFDSFTNWAAKSTSRLNMVIKICGENLREMFKFLKPADFSLKDNNGKNALHFALRHLEMVKLVHQKNSELATETTNTGESSLHLAIDDYKCSEEVALWILKNTEVGKNAETKLNYATLLLACERKKWEVAAQLVTKHNIEVNDQNKSCGKSIFQYAVQSNNTDLVQGLLDRGSNVNSKDNYGVTALHLAAGSNGNSEIVKILLEKGAKVNAQNKDKQTALHYAAENNEVKEVVQKLLEHGADVNSQDEEGNTALHLAAMSYEKNEIVNILLENGAELNLQNNEKQTALHYAFENLEDMDDTEVIQKLLEHGADVNSQDEEGNTALHLAARSYLNPEIVKKIITKGAKVDLQNNEKRTALHYAAGNHKDTEVVQKIIECCIDINLQDKEGFTALHLAARSNRNPEIVKILLENGAKVNLTDNKKRSALHHAFKNDEVTEVVQKLLECGADVNLQDEEGITALHLAAKSNENPEIVQILLEKSAKINELENDKWTALHFAAKFNKAPEIIQMFLEKGANINSRSKQGSTALHQAAGWNPNPEIVNILLKNGAKVNELDNDERTALDFAAKSNPVAKVVQTLLENGADIHSRSQQGSSPLHQAAGWNKNPEIVKILLDKGAKINAVDNKKWTPLHLAARYNAASDIVQMLLENGADVHLQSQGELTALHLAAGSSGNPEIVQSLLLKGAKVDAQDANYWTALHHAAKSNPVAKVVQTLLENGADIHSRSKQGSSALHQAAGWNKNPEIVKILLDKGAKINAVDNKKWTPLHLAARYNAASDIVQMLLENGADVHLQSQGELTALHLAAGFNENPEIVQSLLHKGAKVDAQDEDIWTALHHAAKSNPVAEVVQMLLENGADVHLQSQGELTALHLAAGFNENPEIVQSLLHKGAKVDAQDEDNWTALHHAAKSNPVAEVVQMLLENGADVHLQSQGELTALHLAAGFNENPEIVQSLLHKGAKVDAQDEDNWTALHHAAKSNPVAEVVQTLLENGADIRSRCQQGSTALHQAAGWNKNPEIVKILLQNDAKINELDNDEWTALHFAAKFNQAPEIIQTLLENGADIHSQCEEGLTALHQAAGWNKNPEVVKILLDKGAKINAVDNKKLTPLHVAARYNPASDIVRMLLENGANVHLQCQGELTALHLVAGSSENPEIVQSLLHKGSKVDAQDKNNWTALHHAAKSNPVAEVVQTLLENGAEIHSRSQQGSTALHQAAGWNPNPEIVKILLKNGAKVNELDNDEWTPLHFAAKFNQAPEIIQTLLENGADIHSRCKQGSTALHHAAGWNKNPEIVKTLLDKGAKINAVDYKNWTPLHSAARYNAASDIVRMLLENGADIHLQSQGELTALHLAAGFNENPEIVEALLPKIAEINLENALGETALFLAAKHNRVKEVVQKLLDHGAKVNEMIRNDKECVGVLRKMKVNSEVLKILNENDSDV
ncbi:uncharacterized protein LOC135943804 [Cloeon dipterum]|uniref:uncharacterized protein LOC135943804 n=1 Tax=Cloeon dipterum TaxID=197152 RepID=UPI00321FD3E4